MATAKKSKIIRLITPGLIFQSILIAGGYGTGAELSEFFFPSGSLGGLLSMVVSMICLSVVCAVTFEFARVFKTYTYLDFFKKLIGRFWILFEISYLILLFLVLSVVVAASGQNLYDVFGINKWVGIILLAAGVAYLVIAGTKVLVNVLSVWSYVLYTVYIIFMAICIVKFGGTIAEQLTVVKEINPGWVIGGGKYAFYNLACVAFILYTVTEMESRKEAIASGLIAGAIGIVPGIMLFITMIGKYPDIMTSAVPLNVILADLNIRWFQIIFLLVLFGTFIETGAGFIKAATDRLEKQFCTEENPRKWLRTTATVVFLLLGMFVANFGLTGLIAKGYGTITWVFFVVYIIPLLTIGIYKIYKHDKTVGGEQIK
ncbi:MAG: hypothetical protein LBG27_13845 [Spirochaetaceae bacterium]|jgi:uncharacterized membrane protein YkvI|nr:hypothetical protein [Spirochaetaceae bacterium]